GKCSLNSWVFKSFLKVERDAPALVVLGSSFHQRGTTNENSLDCRTCTGGSAKRHSLEERSILGLTFALTRAFREVGAEPVITLYASISDLNLMRAATGSQWSSVSSGVTCALFGWLNTRRAAAFWIKPAGP